MYLEYIFTAVYGGLYAQIQHFLFFFFFFQKILPSSAPTEPIGLKFWFWVPYDKWCRLPFMSHDDSMTQSES